jgi:hypothetical protein
MTTIACNLECMAADQRVVNSGPMYPADKIFRLGDSLFGTAGDGFMSLVMIEWLQGKRNKPALRKLFDHHDKDSILVIELNTTGIYLWNGWGVPERVKLTHYSIGSGSMSAQNAMNRGDTPEQAVRSAMTLDENTGGDVQVEYLLPPELKRKRGR